MGNKSCLHCDSELRFKKEEFCCFGCETAYYIIKKLNLSQYYLYCKEIYNQSPMKVENFQNKIDYHSFIYEERDGDFSINLSLEGVRCGSCIWLIENSLRNIPNVTNARVNLSTNRLTLHWNGKREDIAKLINLLDGLGYRSTPFDPELVIDLDEKEQKQLLKAIAVSGFATVQLMMIMMGIWFTSDTSLMGQHTRSLLHLFGMLVALPCIFYSVLPFFRSALSAIRVLRSNMDVPISIGIIATVLISVRQYYINGEYTYFDSAAMLIFVLLIGRYLDNKSRSLAKSKARDLLLRQSKAVTVLRDDKLELISAGAVLVGDVVQISAGEKVAVDGEIVFGETSVDNSIITGETIPERVKVGDEVFAGSVNLEQMIRVKVSKPSQNTILAEIIRLIENAEQGRAKYVMIADYAAKLYTPVVLLLSFFTFILWKYIWAANFDEAILNAVAVLIITCPCALGIAVPAVQIIASSRLMNKGILIKTKDALERFAKVDCVVFDKTGTLTLGKPELFGLIDIGNNAKKVITIDEAMQDSKLQRELVLIKSIAENSKHPLAQAISGIQTDSLALNAKEVKGYGLAAEYEGEEIRLGSFKWCDAPKYDDQYMEIWYQRGERRIRLIFQDKLREGAASLVKELKGIGYSIYILSGDRKEVVKKVAEELDISNYIAEADPKEKYRFIEQLNQKQKKVLMIGDGLNDAAALKLGHASISPASGLDIAQNCADAVFQKNIISILEIIIVAKKAEVLVKQNLLVSLIYNAVSMPIAIFGLINPLIAALFMSASSISVIFNSMRLK
jgi:Cu2+-exporting ATPase